MLDRNIYIHNISNYLKFVIILDKMASKTKTREITLVDRGGTFSTFFKKITGEDSEYDFNSLSALRKFLQKEKIKLIHTIKTRHPKSMYELAKLLSRDFKAVNEDVKLLERFGFIEMIAEKTGKRKRLKPIIVIDTINITVKI